MKRIRWMTVLLMVVLLLFAGMAPALAAETENPMAIAFDPAAVSDGETTTATITFDNPEGSTLRDVTLSASLPQGVYAETTEAHFDVIGPGERATWTLPLSAGEGTALLPGSTNSANPSTGLPATPGIAAAIVAAALAVAVGVSVKGKQRKTKALCLILAGFLGAQACVPQMALAAEEPIVLTQSGAFELNGQSATLTVQATIGTVESETEDVVWQTLSTSDAVATGARFFSVVVTSETAFADTVSAEMLSLSGAFEGAALQSVERLDDYDLRLTFGNLTMAEDETAGMITFDKGAFAGEPGPGQVVVDVSTPIPYFDDGISAVNFGDDDSVGLVFCIDTAEFSDTASAADISFDKAGIHAESLTVPSTEGRRDGIVTLRLDNALSRTEQVEALRELTMTIGAQALNCGDLSLKLTLEESPVSVAAWVSDVQADGDTLHVTYDGQVSANVGAVDLTNCVPAVSATTLPGASFTGSAATGTDTFRLTADITREDGVADEEVAKNWLYSQSLILPEGVVTDVYGVAMAEGEYDIAVSAPMTMAVNEKGEALSVVKQLCISAKNFASGDYFGVARGIAGLFGLGALEDQTQVKLDEIINQLGSLNAKTDAINQAVNAMNTSMQENFKNLQEESQRKAVSDFGKAVDNLAWTVNKANSADGGMIQAAMEAAEAADTTVGAEDMVTRICEIVATTEGGGDTFARQTLALGTMMLGNATTETDSVYDLYADLLKNRYNWLSQTLDPTDTLQAYSLNVYVKAYMMSMCYMQSNNSDGRYNTAIQQLANQMTAVSDKADAMVAASTPAAGTDTNLVNGKVCALDNFESNINLYDRVITDNYHGRVFEKDANSRVLDETYHDCMFRNYITPLDCATLVAMEKRKAASGAATLYDEMCAVGFNLTSPNLFLAGGMLKTHVVTHAPTMSTGVLSSRKDFLMDVYDLKIGLKRNQVVASFLIDYPSQPFALNRRGTTSVIGTGRADVIAFKSVEWRPRP